MPSQNILYENIYNLQGLEEQDLDSGEWKLYKINEEDSRRYAGETCAIPTQINVPWSSEAYDLQDNGAIISSEVIDIRGNSFIAARAILDKDVSVNSSIIGIGSHMREGSKALRSQVGPYTNVGSRTALVHAKIGPHTEIEDTPSNSDKLAIVHKSDIGSHVNIGKNSSVTMSQVGDFSTIGENTKTGDIAAGADGIRRVKALLGRTFIRDFVNIGDDVLVARGVSVGSKTTIEDRVIIRDGVNIGFSVSVGKAAVLGKGAKLEHHAEVSAGKNVKPGKIVKAQKPGLIDKLRVKHFQQHT
jgi:UDP-3-O-[3-hydroxymyristoyl] glucosamine N-acyltransferase